MKVLGNVTFASLGMGVSALSGLVFFALIAREIGAEEFGVLSTVYTLIIFAVDLIELTQNTALIRTSGGELQTVSSALKASFIYRVKGALVVTLCAVLLVYPLTILLKNESLLAPYLIMFVGYGGFLLYGLVLGYFQVTRKFHWYAAFLTLNNLVRLVLWIALSYLGLATLNSAALLFAISVWVLTGIGWFFLPRGFLHSQQSTREFSARRVLSLTWFFAIAALQSRLDAPLLLRLAGALQTGLYGAASRVWLPVQSALGALSTVFAPEWARVNTQEEVKRQVRNMTMYMIILLIGSVTAILFFPTFLSMFGQSFKEAALAGRLLGVATMISILTLPATTFLLYATKDTVYLTKVAIVQLTSMIAFGAVLISLYGAVGASLAVLVTTTIALLLLNITAWRRYRRLSP